MRASVRDQPDWPALDAVVAQQGNKHKAAHGKHKRQAVAVLEPEDVRVGYGVGHAARGVVHIGDVGHGAGHNLQRVRGLGGSLRQS